jgi:hypothetical protein
MSGPRARDLRDFARQSGYAPITCPECAARPSDGPLAGGCANCGGSGRIWSSARGSLADDGIERLLEIVSRAEHEVGA